MLTKLAQHTWPSRQTITLSGKQISLLDSAGALCLIRFLGVLKANKNHVELRDFDKQQQELIDLIKAQHETIDLKPIQHKNTNAITLLGEESVHKWQQATGLIALVGDLSIKLSRALRQWRRFQWPSILSNVNSTGIKALPILGLLSFLIGVVLAYQLGLQLETYGANSFIAYLSGMAIFREFSPLITAIIVAGRTSSAFTAQIGGMKINEEIDAISTMGLAPTELLLLPKVIGLFLVFPILIFWSDLFSTLGAMIMSKSMLHVGYLDFLSSIQESVGLKQLSLGLYKAPAFALLIALVGCFQGLRVSANASSLGSQTTKSVVQALFLIIITDAAYSLLYSGLDL